MGKGEEKEMEKRKITFFILVERAPENILRLPHNSRKCYELCELCFKLRFSFPS